MNIIKKVLPLAGIIIIAVLTVCFRTIPKGKSWEGYKVLYVKNVSNPTATDKIIKDCGIKDFVSLNGQHAPIMLSKNSIEETMLKLNITSEENKYLYDRQNYFYDSKGEYLLYYIPEDFENYINDALAALTKAGFTAGIDSTLSYLWLLPVVVAVLAVILTIFSKNKFFYAVTAILPCLYVFCNAFYACAISSSILLLSLFLISNIYGREGAVKKLLNKNILVSVALGISIVSAFSVSVGAGFFYILCIAGTTCALLTSINLKQSFSKRYDFQPVFIRKASAVSVYGGKQNVIMPVMLVASVIIIAYFVLGSLNIVSTKTKAKIKLPGKTTFEDSKLPSFEDFYRWNWNVLTAPYKSLNSNGEYDDEHVVFPRFVTKDGIITQENTSLYYDEAFKKNVYDGIDNLDFNSIESVIKLQGDNFTAGYTDSASYNVSIFSIIMMIMCFTMLLFIYFSAIIGKGGRR